MTLLVALRGKDCLVLAADSRGTFGDPRGITAQNDSMIKAYPLSKHVALLMSGSAELGSLIVRQVEATLAQGQTDGVTAVSDVVRSAARNSYQEWFPSIPAVQGQGVARPDLNFVMAGYDPDAAGVYNRPSIYTLLSGFDFPPMLHDYGFAVNGVPQYALYLLNKLYAPDRSADELAALGVYAITETATQDGKVGGPVRVVTITPAVGCSVLDDAEVGRITKQNDERAEALRASFYERDGDG